MRIKKSVEPAAFNFWRHLPTEERGQRGQKNEDEDHRKVLDDEPTDDDTPAVGVDETPLLQSSEHNDRARDGQCEAEHNARPGGPPHSVRQTKPECRHEGHLADCSRNGDGSHGKQVVEREVQPDAKHQEDDTDFGELPCECLIRDVARCKGSDNYPCDEIPNQKGDAQSMC